MKKRDRLKRKSLKPSGVSRRETFARIRTGVIAIVNAGDDFGRILKEKGATPPAPALQLLGTGFFVDGCGVAITAKHVVQPWIDAIEAHRVGAGPQPHRPKYLMHPPVIQQGDNYTVDYVIGNFLGILRHPTLDIVALTTAPSNPKQVVTLPLSDRPCEAGDEIAICGYPFGSALHAAYDGGWVITPSFSAGIVSAVLPFPEAPLDRRIVF